MKKSPAEKELDGFLAKFEPEVEALGRAAVSWMRQRLPGAVEMVYDNYNALVVGFGPNERVSDALFSVALYPRWVNVFFLSGASLPDPEKRLKGAGSTVRSLTFHNPEELADPTLEHFVALALSMDRDASPMERPRKERLLVIKSVSPKQRPRRPL